MKTPTALTLLAVLVAAPGCSNRETRRNEGAVCVSSSANPNDRSSAQAFAAGGPVYLHYFMAQCLSSSCDTEREASCTVTTNGNTLTVTSDAAWTRQSMGACTDDCGRLHATCSTGPLAAGTYTVEHGGDSVTFTVPSAPAEAPCTTAPLF